jgi:hypothetical protein
MTATNTPVADPTIVWALVQTLAEGEHLEIRRRPDGQFIASRVSSVEALTQRVTELETALRAVEQTVGGRETILRRTQR